jgi:hypothetical protein
MRALQRGKNPFRASLSGVNGHRLATWLTPISPAPFPQPRWRKGEQRCFFPSVRSGEGIEGKGKPLVSSRTMKCPPLKTPGLPRARGGGSRRLTEGVNYGAVNLSVRSSRDCTVNVGRPPWVPPRMESGSPSNPHAHRQKNPCRRGRGRVFSLAPEVGLEPTTHRLTAGCSAIELLRKASSSIPDSSGSVKTVSAVFVRFHHVTHAGTSGAARPGQAVHGSPGAAPLAGSAGRPTPAGAAAWGPATTPAG